MKCMALTVAVLITLSVPAIGHADPYDDQFNPDQYQDVDDAQLLQLAAYALTPIGMGLEWGLMRPLHYLATRSAIAPILSGDKDRVGFGETNNADLVPPGTFGPAPMNLTDTYMPSPPEPPAEPLRESIVPPDSSHQPSLH